VSPELDVSEPPAFRRDLYRGTASYYDRFRLPYPAALFADLCRRTAVDGTGRLLDLACGPGTATFPLSGHFAEVWAVDQEPEAIEFAERKATAEGVRNVRWMAGRAEDVDPDEVFDLVTIGTAFHRLDRRRIADLAFRWLRSGGHLALLWSGTALNGDAPWQVALATIVVDWMQRVGADDRLPADLAEHLAQHPHATVLADAGFEVLERSEFTEIHDWDVDALIGLMYSTSLLSRVALGDQVDAFEADVRKRLRAEEPSGIFREHVSYAYDLAYRPAE
jgi:ubiquinone/menaquinone biosynthesis C-methylase UbiE